MRVIILFSSIKNTMFFNLKIPNKFFMKFSINFGESFIKDRKGQILEFKRQQSPPSNIRVKAINIGSVKQMVRSFFWILWVRLLLTNLGGKLNELPGFAINIV
ncbi:hypothetical protein RF11_02485 [Thelohanellus kitauei]|uniref:Uncharacterized protein n=1 Tax=Thelohanellus kitauei TaxID=669202 RepID=A0A0C2MHU9_THEKT|nr:hypothetical protein RF11_02485 [Thelohanellus kitauei]